MGSKGLKGSKQQIVQYKSRLPGERVQCEKSLNSPPRVSSWLCSSCGSRAAQGTPSALEPMSATACVLRHTAVSAGPAVKQKLE